MPKFPDEVDTIPFFKVREDGDGVTLERSTKKDTVADADFLERGTYHMFLASETTFSLSFALSINTSFATILALYELM